MLFSSVVSFLAAKERHFAPGLWILLLGFSAICVYYLANITIASGQTLEINDVGIFLRDKDQREIQGLRWEEFAKVTERRRLGQLALWDRAGTRRILVDQYFEKFALIRPRVLDEYAKRFQPGCLPISFRTELVLYYETVIYALALVFWGWIARASYYQGEPVASLFFIGFMIPTFYCLLNLYPQLRGPSVLYEDRLVLRGFFKTDEIYKRDVTSVEITDAVNTQSGTKFSLVMVHTIGGKKIKITSKYGSIPEVYLTLRSWLGPERRAEVA
jgi:hypothetical protein